MEEYAVYYVTDEGEWDRSPIDIFNDYDEADGFALLMTSRYPEDAARGHFVVVEH